LPYATFGTWEKVALAKNRIRQIFILCTKNKINSPYIGISQILVIVLKNRSNEIRIRRELPVHIIN
jgi:hypothetical protein